MPTKLKLNGKAFDPFPPSPQSVRVKAFLDKSPADELFTVDEVARHCKLSLPWLRTLGQRGELEGYRVMHSRHMLYGNPKAVKALVALIAEGE